MDLHVNVNTTVVSNTPIVSLPGFDRLYEKIGKLKFLLRQYHVENFPVC